METPGAELFAALWQHYTSTTPQAERVYRLLEERGDTVVNDHIALRTFSRHREMGDREPFFGVAAMAAPFLERGWQVQGDYRFEDKGLIARSYRHRLPGVPKVFISELDLTRLDEEVVGAICAIARDAVPEFFDDPQWIAGGRPWTLATSEFERIAAASEYGGWVAAFGFTANHFTVDVDSLASVADLAELVEVIEAGGFELNRSGGVIKGGPEVLLAQASTRADVVPVEFADETRSLPSCFVEFAQRYRDAKGVRYEGFVPASADKIFESTDRR